MSNVYVIYLYLGVPNKDSLSGKTKSAYNIPPINPALTKALMFTLTHITTVLQFHLTVFHPQNIFPPTMSHKNTGKHELEG